MRESCLNELVKNMAYSNSEKSYRELFDLLFNPLRRFSYCLLKSRELAEEVASDVMYLLWSRRKELVLVENINAYSYIMVRNLSLNILKKESRKETLCIDDVNIDVVLHNDNPEQSMINSELRDTIAYAINLLPPRGKLVFKLIKEDGLSYKEAGEILNISSKTVDAHLVTALKKISAILVKEYNLA